MHQVEFSLSAIKVLKKIAILWKYYDFSEERASVEAVGQGWGVGKVFQSWALNSILDFNPETESIQDRNKNKDERAGQPKEKQEFQVEFDAQYVGILE